MRDVTPGGAGRTDDDLQVTCHSLQTTQPPLSLAEVIRGGAVVAGGALRELVWARGQGIRQKRSLKPTKGLMLIIHVRLG